MEELKKQFGSFFPHLVLDNLSMNVCSDDAAQSSTAKSEPQKPSYASTVFKLPIEYVDVEKKHALSPKVVSDLEMVLGENSMYTQLFTPSNLFAEQIVPLHQTTFTSDTAFLIDTQQVIENMDCFYEEDSTPSNTPYKVPCEQIQTQWANVKHNPSFISTYGYLDWSVLESCNHSSTILQIVTITNMLSPIMSFFIPLLFFLFPFIILKLQGVPISFSIYLDVLKNIARHHFIGKAIMTFQSFSFQNLIYLLATFGIYGLQMYQNTRQCIRFYQNTQKINNDLLAWKEFVNHSISQINLFVDKNKSLNSYSPFCTEMLKQREILNHLKMLLQPIHPFTCSITKTTEIGYMLKVYYELHTNSEYEHALLYSMGMEGYLQCMKEVNRKINTGVINHANYCVKNSIVIKDGSNNTVPETFITQQYYPPHKETGVRNNVVLDTFGVITGPNASGKTTYLKTTAINVILCQQVGVGFFDDCSIHPYTDIHSYLNIPDTSGRDSLFQAESRRCKEILEKIHTNKGRQFCIFDELYSGTNPKEATQAAYAFLEYLRQFSHVDLFLTTHYVSICDQWEENESIREIQNYQMIVEVDEEEEEFSPTYKIGPGISHVEGALSILQNMEYPEEMIQMIQSKREKSHSHSSSTVGNEHELEV
jgi:hypothetical protein